MFTICDASFVNVISFGKIYDVLFILSYFIRRMSPSTGCGPFRAYSVTYDVITSTVDTWPTVIQEMFKFFASPGFLVPAFVFLVLVAFSVCTKSDIR